MKSEITIVHLYPSEMNIYGDLGNVLTLVQRLRWRGYEPKVVPVGIGDVFDMTTADIIFGGGGQDSGQLVVGEDLLERGENLRAAAEAGVVMLVICGTYQLFGRFFQLYDQKIPGIGIFGAETVASESRMIGNVIIKSPWGELVGFENHSGQTALDAMQIPLGEVIKGYGNNERSREEGAVAGNVHGTYLHGPILPKNPEFADHLINTALKRKGITTDLKPLDDKLEHMAAEVAKSRPQ